MRGSRTNRAVTIVLGVLATLAGCGDDAGPGGDTCDAPGTTQRCTCAVSELGRQACLETGYWGDCDCPGSPSTPCMPGGPSPCSGCPDAPAVCTDAGGFDCSCSGDVGGTGGAGGTSGGAGFGGRDAGFTPGDAALDATPDDSESGTPDDAG